MTIRHPASKKPKHQQEYVLPDIPEREPDDMTSSKHLSLTGNHHHLIQHLGNRETTLVSGERYITRSPGGDMRYPDLMVVFDCDPAAYWRKNGYIISEQGKPPDFVLEIASKRTGKDDTGSKRVWYADLAIPEYWRFDETGEFHGSRLGGDRLVGNQYEPIPIETLAEGIMQGYSGVLNLYIRWENGELGWHDPATGQHIATFEQEREGREREREIRRQAEAAQRQEREARIAAEARVRQLEAELALRRQDP
jgi:hypothetical protein